MAKGRMINKRIAKSDKLAALTKDRHRVIYFMLYPHLDREGRYSADPRDIKEDCCPRMKYSLGEISDSLEALHNVGLITIYTVNEKQYLEASRFDDFQVGLHKEREAPSEYPSNPGPTPDNSGNCRTSAEKVPLNLKSKVKVKVKDNVGQISSIIEYLNQKTGKKFSPTSSAAVRHINARIADGRTLEEFKRVIDIKVHTWLNDPKMNAYLRPETLFGTKMESYLNESIIPSAVEKEIQVGSGPEKSALEKSEARMQHRQAMDFVRQMNAKWEPQIEAAKTTEERNRLRDAANAETQAGIKKIHGYEVNA